MATTMPDHVVDLLVLHLFLWMPNKHFKEGVWHVGGVRPFWAESRTHNCFKPIGFCPQPFGMIFLFLPRKVKRKKGTNLWDSQTHNEPVNLRQWVDGYTFGFCITRGATPAGERRRL